MDECVIVGDQENVKTDCGSAGENEQSIGISRKISVSPSNMVDSATISKDVIVSSDDVILRRTFIIEETENDEALSTLPKLECETEIIDCSSPSSVSVTSTSFTPTATHIPRTVAEDEWQIAAQQPVLHVHCKKITGELHKNRFGSGAKGKCIRAGKLWLTPSEFEAYCGRSASKDWKRSIRFQGVTLNDLIEEGFVQVHASCCACSVCLEDNLAAGPVRLYQNYKRVKRRRKNSADDLKNPNNRYCLDPYQNMQSTTITLPVVNIDLRHITNPTSVCAASSSPVEPTCSIAIGPLTESKPVLPSISELPLDKAWAMMSETLLNLLKSTTKAREMLEELRQRTNRELDEQRNILIEEKEIAVRQATLEALASLDERPPKVIPPKGMSGDQLPNAQREGQNVGEENLTPPTTLENVVLETITDISTLTPLENMDIMEIDKKEEHL